MTVKLGSLRFKDRQSIKSVGEQRERKAQQEHLHRMMRSSSLHRPEYRWKKRLKLSSNLEATSPKPLSFSSRRKPPEKFGLWLYKRPCASYSKATRSCSSRNPKDSSARENGTLPAARYCPMKSLRLAPSEKSLNRHDSSSVTRKKYAP